jgi:hypothetical protein
LNRSIFKGFMTSGFKLGSGPRFFRNKDGSTRTYLQLVNSERVDGRVRQRVVANLGRLSELQAGSLDRLIEHLMRFSRRQWLLEKARQIEPGTPEPGGRC